MHFGNLEWWNVKGDGSLRYHGVELCSKPVSGGFLLEAIDELDEVLSGPKFVENIRHSSRAGTHIHVSVEDLTRQDIRMFVALYLLFEKGVYNVAGRKRHRNIFCLPLFEDSRTACATAKQIQGYRPGSSVLLASKVYSGLTVGKWNTYPTIEFRMFPVWTGPKTLLDMVNLVLSLRSGARLYTPQDLVEITTDDQVKALAEQVFGRMPRASKYLPLLSKFDYRSYSTMCKFLEV